MSKSQPSLEQDMWAMGVLTYLLLCGRLPFQGTDDAEMIDNIKKVDYSFEADGQ